MMTSQIPVVGRTMVECLTQDGEAAGLSLTGVTVLCPGERH